MLLRLFHNLHGIHLVIKLHDTEPLWVWHFLGKYVAAGLEVAEPICYGIFSAKGGFAFGEKNIIPQNHGHTIPFDEILANQERASQAFGLVLTFIRKIRA